MTKQEEYQAKELARLQYNDIKHKELSTNLIYITLRRLQEKELLPNRYMWREWRKDGIKEGSSALGFVMNIAEDIESGKIVLTEKL